MANVYRAKQPLKIAGILAFQTGDVVPESTATIFGWIANNLVELIPGGQPPVGYEGPYVPVGGSSGQVLGKSSSADFDTEWITVSGGGGGGSTDPEVVRDTIADALRAGANVTITNDDAANTITIGLSGVPTHQHTAAQVTDLTEAVQDIVGAFIVAGANMTSTYNDAANTLTLSSTGGGGGGGGSTDPEVVRDTIAGALVAGANISINADDAGDTITIGVTGLSNYVLKTELQALNVVRTVNGLSPDVNGNVVVSGGGGGGGPYALNGVVLAPGATVPGDLPAGSLVYRTV